MNRWRANRWIVRLWLPVTAIVLWQIADWMNCLDPIFFPSPLRLAATFWHLLRTGELEMHVKATLFRLGVAYILGSVAGLTVGLTMGGLPFWRRSVQGILSGINASPKLSLLPAFLIVFGLNDISRVLPAAISCFVLIAVYSMDAARAVKPGYIDLARSFGAGRRALLWRVYAPACLPSLFSGLRISLGTGLVMVVATEMFGAQSGLGSFIWITGQTLAVDRMYVGIAVCTLIGITVNYVFERLERRMVPWRTGR